MTKLTSGVDVVAWCRDDNQLAGSTGLMISSITASLQTRFLGDVRCMLGGEHHGFQPPRVLPSLP